MASEVATINPAAAANDQIAASAFGGAVAFETAQRVGKALSASSLVPESYRNNLPNCLIALEIAHRIGASPLMVMQNLYMVQGKPGWSSSFLIATVNASNRFTPLRFETRGDDPFADDYRVRAKAKDKESGEECVGSWITWAMVKAEGWSTKGGSKWKTMPEQMFTYRAAAFWTRVYAPELSLGIRTQDELVDIGEAVVSTVPPAQIQDERKSVHDEAAEQYAESIAGVKEAIAKFDETGDSDALYTARELWEGIPQAARIDLWLAPTKGGCLTTRERKVIKEQLPRDELQGAATL